MIDLTYFQDGADFYDSSDTGIKGPIFTAPAGTVKSDFDCAGATKAEELFGAWCAERHIRPAREEKLL